MIKIVIDDEEERALSPEAEELLGRRAGEVGFSTLDSPLELPSRRNRAEPQCRLRRRLPFAATSGRGPDNKARRGRGTEGSNPSPSSGESTNFRSLSAT